MAEAKVTRSIAFNPELYARLEVLAKEQKKSINAVVNEAVAKWIERGGGDGS
jgi:predicted DNA-binding protein